MTPSMSRAMIVVFLCLVSGIVAMRSSQETRKSIIQGLFDKTAALQAPKDVPYRKFLSFMKERGMYKSDIKLNFYGKLSMTEVRRHGNIYDNNMFVTAWVTSSLLEATRYQQAVRPSDWQLDAALDAIYTHRDMNKAYNTSTYSFWRQKFNQTAKFWSSTPTNLLGLMAMADELPMDALLKILADLGFKEIADEIKGLLSEESTFKSAFQIPPDFDDTFVNLGLGSLLYSMKSQFPTAWSKWKTHNSNLTSAFDAVKKYAYRPFSSDNNVNTIDPRTYYVVRQFLDQAHDAGEDIALVSTWIQNLAEDKTQFYKGVAMPFQVNNVDVTVAANTVFGITSSILAGIINADVLNDAAIAQIYLNTSSLIAHEIQTNLTSRPDLVLLYYPSHVEFDWFVARSVDQMESFASVKPLPHPVMESVYAILKKATGGAMTEYIVSQAKTDDTKEVYFDDFLGDADTTADNKTLRRAEDRMFTTAMAANALLYTWTSCDLHNGTCQWKANIPKKARSTIEGSIEWLTTHALEGKYEPWNAFFCGSMKSFDTLPFWYPGNCLEFINGTEIKSFKHVPDGLDVRYAMRGYMKKSDYDASLLKPHFGVMTPRVFNGFNAGSLGFPLWSAEAYTYSVTLLALSRYDSAVNSH